ncbi:hypothetical protein GA0061103_0780 [Rhizobium multihospitium]|uniref:Uncharacterized protein n=1 Tax=Rhizobium multihospitium TaxID=410764 RepID=A0A1C3XDB8_9HYPH|nr:hypothetical protein GA0061103_0780 [Rhizobium multihospitium]
MSPRFVVVAIVVALVIGLVAGRALFTSPHPRPTHPEAAAQDDAAAAASRAMTFTQPKAPQK